MKTSMEERFRKKMRKFAKKNRFCFLLAVPVLVVGLFCVRLPGYLSGNGKRFAMMGMTFLMFAVYSSFSFPMFVSGESTDSFSSESIQGAEDVAFAKETEIDLDEIELLEDVDVVEDGESYNEGSHGMDIVAQYSASDILDSTTDGKSEKKEEVQKDDSSADDPVFSSDDWRLILVNKQHSIPDDYEFPLGDINTMKGSMHCDARIIDDLLEMLQAAKEDGVTLSICSPYRDQEYQTMLFGRKIKRYMSRGMSYLEAYQLSSQAVTVPGASEHEIGLALDIVTVGYTNLDEGFADTDAGKWLAANSYKYGFILRYPKGKEDITGIEYEPWHFRYVGVDAATVITKNGITLEEFWEDL